GAPVLERRALEVHLVAEAVQRTVRDRDRLLIDLRVPGEVVRVPLRGLRLLVELVQRLAALLVVPREDRIGFGAHGVRDLVDVGVRHREDRVDVVDLGSADHLLVGGAHDYPLVGRAGLIPGRTNWRAKGRTDDGSPRTTGVLDAVGEHQSTSPTRATHSATRSVSVGGTKRENIGASCAADQARNRSAPEKVRYGRRSSGSKAATKRSAACESTSVAAVTSTATTASSSVSAAVAASRRAATTRSASRPTTVATRARFDPNSRYSVARPHAASRATSSTVSLARPWRAIQVRVAATARSRIVGSRSAPRPSIGTETTGGSEGDAGMTLRR